MPIIMAFFVSHAYFSKKAESLISYNNKTADAILGNRASYAHVLSPVERVLCSSWVTSCGTQVS